MDAEGLSAARALGLPLVTFDAGFNVGSQRTLGLGETLASYRPSSYR